MVIAFLSSFSRVLSHCLAGFLLLPSGFKSRVCLHISVGSFRRVCPIYLHFFCFISVWMGNCLQFVQSSLLLIVLVHQIRNKRLNYLLTKTCSLYASKSVMSQVSHPYKCTDFTFELKIRSFVCVETDEEIHILFS